MNLSGHMDPTTAGFLTQTGGQLLQQLFKPRIDPYLEMQKNFMNQRNRAMSYTNSLLKSQAAQQKRWQPIYDKANSMAVERAFKPLTATDTFKGTAPTMANIQQAGDAASSAAAVNASKAGLYGGEAYGGVQSARNSINSALTKNLADFSANYEGSAPARAWEAAGQAGNTYNTAAQGVLNAGNSLQAGYGELANMASSIGQQQAALNQQPMDQHAALMSMLGGYWGDQAQQKMFKRNLDTQRKSAESFSTAVGALNNPNTTSPGISIGGNSRLMPSAGLLTPPPGYEYGPDGRLRRKYNSMFQVPPIR